MRQMLCSPVEHADVIELQLAHDVREELRFLSGGLDERNPELGQSDRERDARQAATRTHVDEA